MSPGQEEILRAALYDGQNDGFTQNDMQAGWAEIDISS